MSGSAGESRANILGRIRRAQSRGGSRPSPAELEQIGSHLSARRRGPLRPIEGDLRALFRARAESLQSTTEQVEEESQLPQAVARYLEARSLPLNGCVWPALAHIGWQHAGLRLDPRPAIGEDAVGVTGAFAALAETGTLMLVSGNDTPGSVSLLPETHIAIVAAHAIVAHMEDGWDRARAAFGHLPRSVNFVSGPSRTGDIEQKMVLGAHGPARVHVIILTR